MPKAYPCIIYQILFIFIWSAYLQVLIFINQFKNRFPAGCVNSNIAWKDFLVECAMSMSQDTRVESSMAILCSVMSEHPDGITTRYGCKHKSLSKMLLYLPQNVVQQGYEHPPFEFWKHLITKFLKFRFQMVQYSNGWFKAMSYVQDKPFKYQTST